MNESLCEWLQVVCKGGIMAPTKQNVKSELNVG